MLRNYGDYECPTCGQDAGIKKNILEPVNDEIAERCECPGCNTVWERIYKYSFDFIVEKK